MKFFFNSKTNLYSKIIFKNITYFIENTQIFKETGIQIKLRIWYYDIVVWFKFKKIYHEVYLMSSFLDEDIKKSIEDELIIVFGVELEKLIIATKRKERINKLLDNEI